MIKKEEIDNAIRYLEEELININCDVIYEFPFKPYLAYLEKVLLRVSPHIYLPQVNSKGLLKKVTVKAAIRQAIGSLLRSIGHLYIGRKRRNWLSSIASSYDHAIICRYNKLVLAFLMRNALDLLPYKNYPTEVVDLYYQWFARVLKDFRERSDDYYTVEEIAFRQDVGVCSLGSIPVGGAWVVRPSGLGLWFFIVGGPRQLLKNLSFIILKTGGISPFYAIHTVSRYLYLFRPEEMDLAYIRIAELMKRDPSMRGAIRTSWFLDPNLEKVSPNLAFLRTVPQENGARLFPSLTTDIHIKYALSMSSIRRRMYEEGKYRPTSFTYIWPRKALIEWAERHEKK
jgi:hypothetical protein